MDNEIESDIIPPPLTTTVSIVCKTRGKGGEIKRKEVEVEENEGRSTCFCGQCQLAVEKLCSSPRLPNRKEVEPSTAYIAQNNGLYIVGRTSLCTALACFTIFCTPLFRAL